MSGDHVSDLRAFCAEWLKQNRGYDLIDHGFGAEHGGELTTVKLIAALDELEKLRADNAALLDGNQRLQTMNNGLRQMAIEAREAAERWHRATIDLYSGREEPHPADCPCGRQESCAPSWRPERAPCCGGPHAGWIHAANCTDPQQPERDSWWYEDGCPSCLLSRQEGEDENSCAQHGVGRQQPERGSDADGAR